MNEPRSLRAFVAVLLTCLVAGLSYAGAVTTLALMAFVLPSLAIAFGVGVVLTRRRSQVSGVIVGGFVALGLAELVNVVSQNSNGPAARSTAVAAGCAVIAGVAVASPWPATFLAAVGGIVAGAMGLGAGGEVDLVAVVAAVFAIASLSVVERSHRRWAAPPRRRLLVGLVALLAAAAAAGVVLLQARDDHRSPELLARGAVHLGIKPAVTDPLTAAAHRELHREPARHRRADHAGQSVVRHSVPPRAGQRHVRRRHHVPTHALRHSSSSILDALMIAGIVIGALLLLVGLALLGRFTYVWLSWRRLRRRLNSGEPAERVAGAWSWAQRWLAACRMALPASLSPDVVTGSSALDDLPAPVADSLTRLSAQVTGVAFAPPSDVSAAEIIGAWGAADDVVTAAYDSVTRHRRALLMLQTPPTGPAVRAGFAAAGPRLGSAR